MKVEDFIPKHDNLLIEPEEKEKVSAGGIIIPDIVEKAITKGVIKAIPQAGGYYTPTNEWRPISFKEGDIVIFGEYAGHEIFFDNPDVPRLKKKYFIIKDQSIFGVIKESK